MGPHRRGLSFQHCCRARRRRRRSNTVGWLNHGVDYGTNLHPGPVRPTWLHSHHRQPLSTRPRFHGYGPTDVFTVTGDLFGDYPVSAAELWVLGFFEHGDYLGLTESEIQTAMNDTATTVVDGLTTYYPIPDPSDLIATLLQTQFNDFFG